MSLNKIRLKRALIFLAVLSFFEYLSFHLLYIAFDQINEFVLLPVRLSISIFPVISLSLALRMHKNFLGTFINMLYFSAVRFVFAILYSYMFLVLLLHIPTVDALPFAPLVAIVLVLIYFILTLFCYGVLRLVYKIRRAEFTPKRHFPLRAAELSSPLTLGLMILPLILFTVELVFEIISTVSFFTAYGSSYRPEEIVWMIFSYLFILMKLVLTMVFSSLGANKLLDVKKEQT